MEQTLTLDIVENIVVQTHTIEWIEVQVPYGSLTIGPGHLPLASLLRKRAVVTFKIANGQVTTYQAAKGSVTVLADHVILICKT